MKSMVNTYVTYFKPNIVHVNAIILGINNSHIHIKCIEIIDNYSQYPWMVGGEYFIIRDYIRFMKPIIDKKTINKLSKLYIFS